MRPRSTTDSLMGVSPSKVLMPMAFATLLGGMATYYTTANIIASSILESHGLRPLGMVDFLRTGGFVAICGLILLHLAADR